MQWPMSLEQQEKHKYDGFQPVDFDLSTARSLHYVQMTGDTLHVLALSGQVEIRFGTPNAAPLVLTPAAGVRAVRTIFSGLYLSHTAQAGAHVRLAAAINFDLVTDQAPAATRIEIDNLPMIGGFMGYPVPPGTTSIALHAVGGDVDLALNADLTQVWTIPDGQKDVLNARLTGPQISFSGAVGTTLQIRRLMR